MGEFVAVSSMIEIAPTSLTWVFQGIQCVRSMETPNWLLRLAKRLLGAGTN